ncbi:MAG: glycosyltransferase family 1 protein [Patescibacteria group bacterium]
MTLAIEASHANKAKRTGVEEYSWQIIQHLKKVVPSDVQVILYSQTPLLPGLADLPANWQSRVLAWPQKMPRRLRKGWTQTRLSWEFFRHPPDIFFAPAQLVPMACPEKTVVTVHDSAFVVYPKLYGLASRTYLKWMNKLIVKKARAIITPSEFSKNELVKYYGADKNKIFVTPLGYDKDTYYPAFDNARQGIPRLSASWRIARNDTRPIAKKYILSVGRLENKKNTANIVRAFDIVRRECDCQLVLAGTPGVGYAEVEQAILQSPYNKDIILTGWVETEDIAALMRSAEVFIFPSRYEGFGIPVLEAMASGCPVIASRGNSLPQVGGEAAIYVSPDDIGEIAGAIIKILTDQNFKNQMTENGLVQAQKFSWQKTAELTWQALR